MYLYVYGVPPLNTQFLTSPLPNIRIITIPIHFVDSTMDMQELADQNFELIAELVDKIVPELAPDLFRLIDVNNDGTIKEDEWKKLFATFEPGSRPADIQRALFDAVFTVLDKDGNKIVEPKEVSDFARKVVHLVAMVVKTVLKANKKSIKACMNSKMVDDMFRALDQDGDGRLTIEEVTLNFNPMLLSIVKWASMAAPVLYELRAPRHETLELMRQIEFLKSKGATLDGFEASEPVPPYSTGNKLNLKMFGGPMEQMQSSGVYVYYLCVYCPCGSDDGVH